MTFGFHPDRFVRVLQLRGSDDIGDQRVGSRPAIPEGVGQQSQVGGDRMLAFHDRVGRQAPFEGSLRADPAVVNGAHHRRDVGLHRCPGR